MRIGTWNVDHAPSRRLAALRQVLSENVADIWVLTETRDELVPPSCRFVAHSGPRPKSRPTMKSDSRWVSIWSRYPIIAQLPTIDHERTVVAMLAVGGNRKLLVYGTVLPWKGDPRQADRRFDWSEHHRVIQEQCTEWLDFKNHYPDADLCVAGDYNSDMATGGYYGTAVGIAALNAGLSNCGLYCATQPSQYLRDRLKDPPIDHIALPIAWRQSASVVACWPKDLKKLSDHSGMIVEAGEEP